MLWSQAQIKGNVCSCVILFISLTLWMPTCPSFVGIIFQKHSGRMKRQNVVHESPAEVSKCVNSQRNLSQMSHREKTFLRMSHRVKACLASCGAAGLPCRQIFANIYLTEFSVKVKPLPKRTKNKHGHVASFWTRSKIGSTNLEHWTASDPKWGQAIKMCCAFAALPLIIFLHSDWFLSSDCSLFLTSHCSVFVTSHCWVSPLIAQFSLSFDCLQFLPSNCPLLSLEKINILPHTAGVCCISSSSEH